MRQFVDAERTNARILDTPQDRAKLAGHRQDGCVAGWRKPSLGLYDMMFIKDNYIDFAGHYQSVEPRVSIPEELSTEVEARTSGRLG